MKNVRGRNALITGASRGIGVSIAKRLAEEGVNLALVARSADALEQVRDEVARKDVKAIAVPADLSRLDSLEPLVKTVERDLGPIDILINNAGLEACIYYETFAINEIEKTVVVNLLAPMILTRLLLPGMLARDRGYIVNISSAEGLLPVPFSEVYSATKHGLVGFTYSLRMSFIMRRSSLGATAICTGAVTEAGMYQRAVDTYGKKSKITDLFVTSTPKDVANLIVRVIRQDKTIVTAGKIIRPLHLLLYSVPRITEWLAIKSGWFEPARYFADIDGHGADSNL